MKSAHFEMPLRVRYVECDMQGRVFNAHYLTWIDMAHTDAISHLVGPLPALLAEGIDFVVAAAELQFRRPATFNDELVVAVSLHPPGRTSLRSDYTFTRGEDLIAEATMTHVCVDATSYEKTPWPDWVRSRLADAG